MTLKLLTKFESKSNRVKGIAFHPKRPWVLSTLHNGTIQLWDYRMGTLIDKFEEHDGPVRGVAFHPTQDIFCSGGDDKKIKVWSLKTRRCLFTLTGHMDYIRTVTFHHELPWIMSASDDQTIRIWNWQSRNCISTVTGHNHYIMCAKFHPSQDLIASACLDLTVRIWDFSSLRKKYYTPQSASTRTPEEEAIRMLAQTTDVFGNMEVTVKFVLEGHTKGVNWVEFHPTMPLIVSGGDDRQVKLWRMNDSRAWEVDTCRGHYNNVSCCTFHPRQELLVSNSEDRSIRVWDMTKRSLLQTFRREGERYWVLASHPNLNVFAAGHDGGMIIFKLERERPAMSILQDTMLYVKENHVRIHNFTNGSDSPVITIKKEGGSYTSPPRSLTFNPVDKTVILSSDSDSGTRFELFKANSKSDDVATGLKGMGSSPVFISRNRFAVLDKEKQQLDIRDLECKSVKTIKLTTPVNEIFAAPGGNLLLSSSKSIALFDVTQKKEIATLPASDIKYIYWSNDNSKVALFSKHLITIAEKDLTQLCQIHETIRVKSGAWDPIGVFLYTTLNHIKYLLPQGDSGIICTLDQPIYLTKVKNQQIHYLDRLAEPQTAVIDPSEYKFKLALIKQDYDQVIHSIRHSNLVGQSIIAYLRKKGYSEIALHFIKEERTRFELALECGNLDVALTSAKEIDNETTWIKLGKEALKQGNLQIVTLCYQKVHNFDRLSFLYFITGDLEKVQKMQSIAEKRNDYQAQFHNALYLGDSKQKVKVLRETGQDALAYITAKNAGLEMEAEEILASSNISEEVLAKLPINKKVFTPSKPIAGIIDSNWPTLNVSKGAFDRFFAALEASQSSAINLGDDGDIDDTADGWGDEDYTSPTTKPDTLQNTFEDGEDYEDAEEEGGWGLEDDMDINEAIGAELVNGVQSTEFIMPQKGGNDLDKWARNSPLAADHIAAGSFESAMQLLNRQLGIINFEPLKTYFMDILSTSQAYYEANHGLKSLSTSLSRNYNESQKNLRPIITFTVSKVITQLKEGYKLFKANKIEDSLIQFQQVLKIIPLVIADLETEQEEIHQMVKIAREYVIGLSMEKARRELSNDGDSIKRNLELAAYFTHCELDPQHTLLALRVAMTTSFKQKNFLTASSFAQRVLELGPNQQLANQAKQIQTVSERSSKDEIELDYDQYNPFTLCCQSYTPIYSGSEKVECAYCKANYLPEFKDKVCNICQLAKIDGNATGLRCF
ncbi:Coatomer, alpha subunit [Neoconidiobolus thromboides FSU 785]|nr:Coatomer, alpha subunit [Neoconidiobolus thromboides FSU 785]